VGGGGVSRGLARNGNRAHSRGGKRHLTGEADIGTMDGFVKGVHDVVTRKLPRYLQSLPVPKSTAGYTQLGQKEVLILLWPTLLVFSVLYFTWCALFPDTPKKGTVGINASIHLDRDKVVNNVSVADIEDTATKAYCRCWKSKKFPYCDGAHNKHNKECGDNVGPLIIKGKSA